MKRLYFKELEGLRGLAIVSIVVFHAYQFSAVRGRNVYAGHLADAIFRNLDFPVAMFLALSGFLLFLPMAQSALNQDGAPSTRRYVARRIARLLPVYFLAITVVWTLRNPYLPGDWRDLVEHLSFTQVFDRARIFYTIGPAWYVSLEFMYSLGLAGVGVFAFRMCRRVETARARFALLGCVPLLLIMVSAAYKWWEFSVSRVPLDHWEVWFGPLARLDAFALGMLLAVCVAASRGRAVLGRFGAVALSLLAAALLVAASSVRKPDSYGAVYFHTCAGLAASLLLSSLVLSSPGGRLKGILCTRPLAFLGTVSYGVFLWHEPLMRFLGGRFLMSTNPLAFPLNASILILLAAVAGALTYAFLEFPFRDVGRVRKENFPKRKINVAPYAMRETYSSESSTTRGWKLKTSRGVT